jgi:hypothetical protein
MQRMSVPERQAERSEAPRFSNIRILLAMNEILRRSAPQNDISQEPVISSGARNPLHPAICHCEPQAKQSPRCLMGDCHVALTGSSQ